MKDTVVLYVHGKGGSIEEVNHYKSLFPNYDVLAFDYVSQTPWEFKEEFQEWMQQIQNQYENIILIGNSIGAFFAMMADVQDRISKAYFISPVVDMEMLILNRMKWANVSEEELQNKGEIVTDFEEVLSWKYLSYVREHPIRWKVYTHILYGEKDNLTSLETMREFTKKNHCSLHIMKEGEHWFHTTEQMDFLDQWVTMHEMLVDPCSKIHTTEMGVVRIQKNLGIEEDVVEYCKRIVQNPNSNIYRKGKNWYVEYQDEIFTINAYSLTIITAHRRKGYE